MISPAPSCSTSWQARSTAGRQHWGSSPFSYRPEASVRIPSFLAVIRTELPLKLADSKTIMWVFSLMPENSPPMTPATAVGALSSAMTSISGVRVRLTSSRVVMVSPSAALRTMILPPLTYW